MRYEKPDLEERLSRIEQRRDAFSGKHLSGGALALDALGAASQSQRLLQCFHLAEQFPHALRALPTLFASGHGQALLGGEGKGHRVKTPQRST